MTDVERAAVVAELKQLLERHDNVPDDVTPLDLYAVICERLCELGENY